MTPDKLGWCRTLAGAPLCRAAAFEPVAELEDASGGAVPLIRMARRIGGPRR